MDRFRVGQALLTTLLAPAAIVVIVPFALLFVACFYLSFHVRALCELASLLARHGASRGVAPTERMP